MARSARSGLKRVVRRVRGWRPIVTESGGSSAGGAQRGSLRQQAVRGVPWTVLAYAGNRGISFFAGLALARLLAPSDFGLIALANTTLVLLNYLRDLGLGNTIVLRHDLTRHGQGTVFTLMIALGVGLGAVCALLGPVVASLFDKEELTGLLRVLAVTLCLGGVQGFGEAQLQKHLEFRKRSVSFVSQALVYAGVASSLWPASESS